MQYALHAKVFRRAAETLGSPEALQKELGVSMTRLELWMDGVEAPPTEIFLKIVDIVLGPDGLGPDQSV